MSYMQWERTFGESSTLFGKHILTCQISQHLLGVGDVEIASKEDIWQVSECTWQTQASQRTLQNQTQQNL